MGEYNPVELDKKWQAFWDKNKTFKVGAPKEKKLYCLDMFPYPSGAGLHVGHPLGYTATDIYCRYKRMTGYSVLHPMGFDAFGLPAEQHAVNTGEHPSVVTLKSCETYTNQMKWVGLSYDWDRTVATCTPDYYKWTQWIFLKLYDSWFDEKAQKARPIAELPIPEEVKKKGEKALQEYQADHRLAYYGEALVNWCPALGTVLANEEVIDGKSERGGHDVIRKPMKQWFLRITKYAERLIKDLDEIEWPNSIKDQQRNWIGKKRGAEIHFPVEGTPHVLRAFTTRPDTLFGVTFFVISPEHPLADAVTLPEFKEQVAGYRAEALKLSDFLRTIENRKKTGVFTGSYVVNPITKDSVPLYVGDYVLMGVGTGAVMGVPSHDERDFEFARTFQLQIKPVIVPEGQSDEVTGAVKEGEMAWTEKGRMLPCEDAVGKELALAGKWNDEAADLIVAWLAKNDLGKPVVNYKLRDWLYSRQRYWGEPIPIIHWEDGTMSAVRETELPLVLPELADYKPSEGGESPLAKAESWVNVSGPGGKKGRRETNTMPQWGGSCWYYLRYIDPKNEKAGWDKDLEKAWMPVDLYVGGAEHAVLHLLYSRFWHKVLYDLGHVSTNEPFQRLFNQGMVLANAYKNGRGALVPVTDVAEGEDGVARDKNTGEALERLVAKMSKSLRNVVNLDYIVQEYGADTFRLYLMFMGPLDTSRVWDPKAINGVHRFLKKVWAYFTGNGEGIRECVPDNEEPAHVRKALHRVIKKIGTDIEGFSFNTAVSSMMEFLNAVSSFPASRDTLQKFALVLAPLAPHLAEELWEKLGHKRTIAYERFPEYDESFLKEDVVTVVIQVKGKKRALIEVAADIGEEQLRAVVADKMAGTDYALTATDRLIVVRQPGTTLPKLVNVVPGR